MEIKKYPKFIQFVGENKAAYHRRIQYELRKRGLAKLLKEKKDFILSEEDIDAICKGVGSVYPKIRKAMESSELSEEDYEDIFQESVIALYKKIGTKIECTLNTFFYAICLRQTLKFVRDKKKTDSIDSTGLTDSALDTGKQTGVSAKKLKQIIQTIPSANKAPDELSDINQMKERVSRALDEMAGKCKQLLTKFYIEGYSWEEIANDYELKDSQSAKVVANRCRKRLKEKYIGLRVYVNKK